MNISLIRFLQTGSLGEIRVGWTVEDIQALRGPPNASAKSSRKYRYPDIWLYGGVEFWIERIGHGWDKEFKMPTGFAVEDWDLLPYMPRDLVETYLKDNSIAAFQPKPKKPDKNGYVFAPRNLVVPSSGLTLGFGEDWRLNHFLAGPLN